MPVNSTHPDFDAALPAWTRARDVMAGEDAIKAAGIRYLSKLDSRTDEEYIGYKSRASFFNATARTVEVYLGLIFRRPPFQGAGRFIRAGQGDAGVRQRHGHAGQRLPSTQFEFPT